jgi:hypothetical protein
MEATLCDAVDGFRDYLHDDVRSSVRSGAIGLGAALFLSALIELDTALFRAAFGCLPPPLPVVPPQQRRFRAVPISQAVRV